MSVGPDSALGSDVEEAVRERYGAASQAVEPALCCPVDYEPRHLEVIPEEILERDYGCGDPSRFVREGETVLDLGSGAGKICYIASQIVGAQGAVIGVDMTDPMLALAREHRPAIAAQIGWDNVRFVKGRIQDLRTDLEQVEARLSEQPVDSVEALAVFERWATRFEREPMIPDGSVDLVLSNCVLNLVRPQDKDRLFGEIFRVLKRGGRAVISDIVADEDVPPHLVADPELWSGCISGAMREDAFLEAFVRAGFHGVEITAWAEGPWQVVEGIEFRSVMVSAHKGKQGACWDCNQAVIYKGPYKSVLDDDEHTYPRGERVAVCEKTFSLLKSGPYAEHFVFVEPREPVPLPEAPPFDCSLPERGSSPAEAGSARRRDPRESKGAGYDATESGGPSCC